MAKIKIAKKSTRIDMTAMCDVAFLLLSFFIMSATSKQPDPKPVDTPASTKETKLPEKNLMTITIGDSAVYLNFSERDIKIDALDYMARKYGETFTPEEIKQFSLTESFGVPFDELHALLAKDAGERNTPGLQKGIPYSENDFSKNEFSEWIFAAREATIIKQQAANAKEIKEIGVAIKGSSKEKFPTVKRVFDILQKQNMNDYYLVTSLRDDKF
jgi:biopolymer transport protein ExbD